MVGIPWTDARARQAGESVVCMSWPRQQPINTGLAWSQTSTLAAERLSRGD